MSPEPSIVSRLRDDARVAEELHERSRRMLVGAARAGASAGLTQRQISEAIGRSQPEVSRLLRFHGRSPLGQTLEANRKAVIKAAAEAGAKYVRVFGSVSRAEDTAESDIDLLVDLSENTTLFGLGRLESKLSEMLGATVDVVPADSLRTNLRERVLAEAIPL
jgi:predicted nucleotidyltransferase